MYLRNDDSPYYIGKGKNNRAYSKKHRVEVPSDISKIIILNENLSEKEALNLEVELISKYGRLDTGSGCLENRTNGGDGISGWIPTEENKKNISRATSLAQSDPKFRESRRKFQQQRIENGNHAFIGGEMQRRTQSELIISGKHHFSKLNPNLIICSCIVCHKETTIPGLGKHKLCRNEKPAKVTKHLGQVNNIRVSCIECKHETSIPSLSRHIKHHHSLNQNT